MFRSEFGQDRIALEALGNKRHGRFLDIGATDGITRNNSIALERHFGWQGVCVEPVPHFYEQLRTNRAGPTVHACVGGHAQVGLARFNEDLGNPEVSRMDSSGALLVPCITINHILAGIGWSDIDFLSIDTEGNELQILSAIDFKRVTIRVITFEHNAQWGVAQQASKDATHHFLTAQGFKYLTEAGVDSIYTKL